MTEEQLTVVKALVGEALNASVEDEEDLAQSDINEGDEESMKHNVFEGDTKAKANTLSHSEESGHHCRCSPLWLDEGFLSCARR